jgi:hypothetical protein
MVFVLGDLSTALPPEVQRCRAFTAAIVSSKCYETVYAARRGRPYSRCSPSDERLPHGGRSRDGTTPQDRWADDRAWTVSWMSMNRIDQYPGRGSGSSCRDRKNPVNVTTAAASQMITPTARSHGVESDDITIAPAIATASPTYPTRRAQTAILQCPLSRSSDGSFMREIVPRLRALLLAERGDRRLFGKFLR